MHANLTERSSSWSCEWNVTHLSCSGQQAERMAKFELHFHTMMCKGFNSMWSGFNSCLAMWLRYRTATKMIDFHLHSCITQTGQKRKTSSSYTFMELHTLSECCLWQQYKLITYNSLRYTETHKWNFNIWELYLDSIWV